MDAVEYVKTQFRLCKSKDSCSECPLQDKENCCCIMDTIEYVEKAVQIVEQWAKEHPVKTRQSEFLKVFPKATISNHVLSLCPKFYCVNFLGTDFQECEWINCDKCRCEYWLAEVTNNDVDEVTE